MSKIKLLSVICYQINVKWHGYTPSKITAICQNCQILPDVPAKVFKWNFRLFFYHLSSRLNVTFADNNSFFCNAARSRSIVLCVTDKTSDIISALSTNNNNNETRGSSYYVEDGSFLTIPYTSYSYPICHNLLLENPLASCKVLSISICKKQKQSKETNWKQIFQKPENENIFLTYLNTKNNWNIHFLSWET